MKPYPLLSVIFFLLFFSLKISAQTDDTPADTISEKYHYNQVYDYSSNIVPYNFNADSLILLGKKYIGIPYIVGGKEPSGFDCSGFTFYCYKHFGIYLPYFTYQQGTLGKEILQKEAKKGDLVCFRGSNKYDPEIQHVGIVISNKGEKLTWIHASTHYGIHIDNIDNPYYKPRFVTIRRVAE